MVLSFVKSSGFNQKSKAFTKARPEKIVKTETGSENYDSMKLLIGFNYDTLSKIGMDNQNSGTQAETTDQKFKRLMKESEESLKNSRKVI